MACTTTLGKKNIWKKKKEIAAFCDRRILWDYTITRITAKILGAHAFSCNPHRPILVVFNTLKGMHHLDISLVIKYFYIYFFFYLLPFSEVIYFFRFYSLYINMGQPSCLKVLCSVNSTQRSGSRQPHGL